MSDIKRETSMKDRLVARAVAILTSPTTEWPVIAAEPATPSDIYRNYVLVLAAIPPLFTFIKYSLIGVTIPFAGTIRIGIISGLSRAVISYALALIGVFVIALIIDALAPRFGGTKDQVQALKTAAYAYTGYWVAGIGAVLPLVGVLVLFAGGVYSLYLLYLGLPHTMKSPPPKAVSYTALVVICAIAVSLALAFVSGQMFGGSAALVGGGLGGAGAISRTGSDVHFDPDSPLGQLEAWANRLDQANKSYEAAQASGDTAAQQKALGNLVGTALGSGDTGALPPDELRRLVPEKLTGLSRSDISVTRNGLLGIQMSEAHATYGEGAKRLQVELDDLGGARGLAAFAAWVNLEQEEQTKDGYSRTYKRDGRIVHEEWNNKTKSGEYSVVAGNRFLVKVTGGGETIDTLKTAANAMDLTALEDMARKSPPR